MPPKSKNSIEQEGMILLAMSIIQKKEITNIREAARLYNIARTTLRDRLKGSSYRAEQRGNGHKLTQK